VNGAEKRENATARLGATFPFVLRRVIRDYQQNPRYPRLPAGKGGFHYSFGNDSFGSYLSRVLVNILVMSI